MISTKTLLRPLGYALIFGMSMVISACFSIPDPSDVFHDRSTDYLQVKPIDPIKIPDGFDSRPLGDSMIIPNAASVSDEHLAGAFVVPQPNRLSLSTDNPNYRIDQLNGEAVILSHRDVDQTWKDILPFWKKQYPTLAVLDAKQHKLETPWFHVKGVNGAVEGSLNHLLGLGMDPEQGRFRVSVTPSTIAGDSYIRVQYASMAEENHSNAVPANWKKKTDDELNMAHDKLNQLLVYLSLQVADNTSATENASKTADTAVLDGRSHLIKDGNGSPILQINLSYPEAWIQVQQAIKAAKITLNDENQSTGIFYISLPDALTNNVKNPSKGWFSKASPKDQTTSPYQLRLTALNDGKVHLSLEKDVDTLALANVSNYILAKIQAHL